MIMHIQRYRMMMLLKPIKLISFTIICLFFLLIRILFAESSLIISAVNSKGEWRKGVITNREVAFVESPLLASEIQIDVPKAGQYQLFAYIHHNYRKAVPCIYVEAVDSEGRIHKGYHKVENIWYLDKESPGRWFFVSLSQNPYWELSQGKLNISFWAEAKKAPWIDETVPMEGSIAIENFILVPIQNSESGMYLSWLINPETAKGNWDVFDYHQLQATNLIEIDKDNSVSYCLVNIPKSAYYRISAVVLSLLENNLKIIFKRKSVKQEINFGLEGKDTWHTVNSKSLFLNEGNYSMILRHCSVNKIMIDYLILLPESEEHNLVK